MAKMPAQRPSSSFQAYTTPLRFLHALQEKLGIGAFTLDAACSEENQIPGTLFGLTLKEDALSPLSDWNKGGWTYCNPPYGDLRPWVRKARDEATLGASIAMLLPASVGANWWREFVESNAFIFFLNGRLSFPPQTAPYPKDLATLIFTPWLVDTHPGSAIWDWRAEPPPLEDPTFGEEPTTNA